jgi:hypothetical protein
MGPASTPDPTVLPYFPIDQVFPPDQKKRQPGGQRAIARLISPGRLP